MGIGTVGLRTHIWNNNLRSLFLLCIYPVLLTGILWAICYLAGAMIVPQPGMYGAEASFDPARPVGFATSMAIQYWPLVMTVVALWFVVAWFFNTRMVRALSHSRPVTRKEEPELYNLLENLCISAGMKMPKLEIIESHARNAFASGVDERSYTITVTRGLMNTLRKDEVEAVLGHELTHIMNRDVRLLIVSIIFTGLLGFAAQMAWSSFRYNIFGGRARYHRQSSGNGSNRNSAVIMIFVLGVMLILWLGYMATLLTRFALSRRREFMADAGSITLTKNPDAMMRALMRIAQRDKIPEATGDIALMCIQNSHPFLGIFATHPPIDARIRAISTTTGTPIPSLNEGIRAPDEERFDRAREGNPWLTRERPARKPINPWNQK